MGETREEQALRRISEALTFVLDQKNHAAHREQGARKRPVRDMMLLVLAGVKGTHVKRSEEHTSELQSPA